MALFDFGSKKRFEELKKCMEEENYDAAVNIADKISVHKAKSISELNLIGKAYKKHEDFLLAKDFFERSYAQRCSRTVLMDLMDCCLEIKDLESSERYFNEYQKLVPEDKVTQYKYRYEIEKRKDRDRKLLIMILEELKALEYVEEYAYELARQYHKAGRKKDCINECNEMISWFGNGDSVERARILLAYYRGEISLNEVEGNSKYSPKRNLAPKEKVNEEKEEAWISRKSEKLRQEVKKIAEDAKFRDEVRKAEEAAKARAARRKVEEAREKEEQRKAKENIKVREEIKRAEEAARAKAEVKKVGEEARIREEARRAEEAKKVKEEAKQAEEERRAREMERAREELKRAEEAVAKAKAEARRIEEEIKAQEEASCAQEEINDDVEKVVEETIETSQQAEVSSESVQQEIMPVESEIKEVAEKVEAEIVSQMEDIKQQDAMFSLPIKEEQVSKEEYLELANALERNQISFVQTLKSFARVDNIKQQVMHSMDAVLKTKENSYFIIMGESKSGKTTLGLSMIRLLFECKLLHDDRTAIIDAVQLNKISFIEYESQLQNCNLIIEHASSMKEETAENLIAFFRKNKAKTFLILEDSKEGIEHFVTTEKEWSALFYNQIVIPEYTREELMGFAYDYITKEDYSIDSIAAQVLFSKIDEIIKNHGKESSLFYVIRLVKEILSRAEQRISGLLLSMATQGKIQVGTYLIVLPEDIA